MRFWILNRAKAGGNVFFIRVRDRLLCSNRSCVGYETEVKIFSTEKGKDLTKHILLIYGAAPKVNIRNVRSVRLHCEQCSIVSWVVLKKLKKICNRDN